jgi:hypothetical protein
VKTVLAITAAAVAIACTAVFGCSSDSGGSGGSDLPTRDTTDAGKTSTSSSSGATPDAGANCSNLALKTSDTPSCDTCVKDKCCEQVLACDQSFDCKALQQCIAPCDQSDFSCILTCQTAHDKGAAILAEVGQCAQFRCGPQCPDQTPDSGTFDAF